MRRAYKLENLDCANCAAKMESDINSLEGVNKASISFMTGKLMIDADESIFTEILDSASSICKKYEPDCTILI